MISEPFQKYEIPGPIKALVISKPKVVSSIIKRAKNPIFIVGHESTKVELNGKKPIDYVIRMAKASDIPVVAVSNTAREFLKRDFKPKALMASMEIGNLLTDPNWSINGKGPHDIALILGITYYVEWVILSGLKSFAYNHLKTISLDRYYQPNANWSFPNLSLKEWYENLEEIARELGVMEK
ncbi:MAG: CO dehydrogenase/acetyl-CoA synthase complex subunit epsilon [Nitrososphaerales archaeon]